MGSNNKNKRARRNIVAGQPIVDDGRLADVEGVLADIRSGEEGAPLGVGRGARKSTRGKPLTEGQNGEGRTKHKHHREKGR